MNYVQAAKQTEHDRNESVKELRGLKDEQEILIKALGICRANLARMEERVEPLEKKIQREAERVSDLSNKLERYTREAAKQTEQQAIQDKRDALLAQIADVEKELGINGVTVENRD